MLAKRKNQALLLSALFAAVQLFPPPSAVAQPPAPAAAPAADPAAAPGSGPIDIQAAEQEFTGDHVIAKGNVKVLYKDTVIRAPLATLYRDLSSGQPQKAMFNGHPWLIQGANKIDADELIFEMTTSKIYAQGHAHSEVVNNDPVAAPADKKGGPAPPPGKAGMVSNGKGGFEWPTQESDRKKAQTEKQGSNEEDSANIAGDPGDGPSKPTKESKNDSKKDSSKIASKDSGKDSGKESGKNSGKDSNKESTGTKDSAPESGTDSQAPLPRMARYRTSGERRTGRTQTSHGQPRPSQWWQHRRQCRQRSTDKNHY